MNKEQKKFKRVIKERVKRAGRIRFEREKKVGINNKINKIRDENIKVKK